MNTTPKFDRHQPPLPLMINEFQSFAYITMTTRIPSVAQQILTDHAHRYPPRLIQRVQAVHDALFYNQPLTPLHTTAPDQADWQQLTRPYLGTPWLDLPWYLAESFFYRQLIEATGYFGSDEWAGHDPYLPAKSKELGGEAAWLVLRSALQASQENSLDSLQALLHFCVWGNRIDLSYTQVITTSGTVIAVEQEKDNLLVDDTAQILTHLQQGPAANHHLHFICDNAGTELLTDLALTDFLLRFAWAGRVTLHLKAHPTYVSDTTRADIDLTLAAMRARKDGLFSKLATRLLDYQQRGQLLIQSDFFWSSGHFFWDLPAHLHHDLSAAHLVIFKGDANYRRLLGDSRWPSTVSAQAAIPYFPAPLLALRTLKSDPIVGLEPGQAEQLDQVDPTWRVNGRRGIIQAVL